MTAHRSFWRVMMLAAFVGAAACADQGSSTAPPTSSPSPPPPTTSQRGATITVNVAMVGNGADSDGFVVRIGNATLSFAGAGTQVDSTVPTGPQNVQLSGLAGNCAADTTSASVTVADTSTRATVSFTVECYGGFAYTAIDANDSLGVHYLDETGHISRLFPGPEFASVRDWSADGAYALIQQSDALGNNSLWIVARSGGFTRELPTVGSQVTAASFSPVGSQLLYTRFVPPPELVQLRLTDVQGTFDRALFSDSASFINGFGTWSPDGAHIAYISTQFNRSLEIAAVHADGSGPVAVSNQPLGTAGTTGWSPDGQFIAAEVSTSAAPTATFIALFPAAGGAFTQTIANPLLLSNSSDFSWAPDGTRLAMTRQDPDAPRVVVVNRGSSQSFVVAPGLIFSEQANWSPDGARILFIGSLASSGGQPWIFVAHPDGTHVHPVVEGAMLDPNYPIWNRTAKPGMRDR